MAQGGGNGQLHFHAAGKLLDDFVFRQAEVPQVAGEGLVVPVGVQALHVPADLTGSQHIVKAGLVEHHANALFHGGLLLDVVQSEEADGSRVAADQVENELDGGALARAVGPYQAGDGAGRHREVHVVQAKPVEPPGQPLYLQNVVHGFFYSLMR